MRLSHTPWTVFLACLALVLGAGPAVAESRPPAAAIRLVVVGDDTGALHGFNQGTVAAHTDGILTDTNVIVPGPWLPHIAALSRQHPDLGFGIHLALTSEWEAVKWRPLTYPKTLVDADGFLLPMVWPNKAYPGQSLKEVNPSLQEIETELRAQIELALRRIPRVSYLWQHMGLASYSKDAQGIVKKLSDEYGLPDYAEIIETLKLRRPSSVDAPGAQDKSLPTAERLARQLEHLGPGTWMLGGHLAIDSAETRALSHQGGVDVVKDRAGVMALYRDARVRKVVADRGIALIPVATLAREFLARKGLYRNPIADANLPDPFILTVGGVYYMYATGEARDGRRIPIYRSRDLANWTFVRGAVAVGAEGAWNRRNFWAPEVMARGGKYYLYYTAMPDGTPENTGNRIGAAVARSPEGPFEDAGVVVPHGAIDGHPFSVGKKTYLYYTIEHGNADGLVAGQIYVDELRSPLKVMGRPRQILAQHQWQEGPFLLRVGKTFVLTYSTGSWRKDTYQVRWATSDVPLGPFAEQPGTVLASTEFVKGPGHHSFFQVPTPEGKSETWIVYHGWDPGFTARTPRLDRLRMEGNALAPSGPSRGPVRLPFVPAGSP